MNGIVNILKPPGMTSQDVVTVVKRILKVKKAGHTGTLDPGAAGVLPVCIGKATRISEYLLNDKKSYRAEMKIGLKSDTLDRYGVIEHIDVPQLSLDEINDAFARFKGEIHQIPPMYSAVKQGGKPLYELARQGIVVERKIRKVYIYALNIVRINHDTILFDVDCSKGTYIRTLCSDIGKALGSDAIMTFLIRTKTGPFDISSAITFDELSKAASDNKMESILFPIEDGINGYTKVFVDEMTAKKAINGVGFAVNSVIKYEAGTFDDSIMVFNPSNDFIAIGRLNIEGDFIKINKVFA